jgi:hypothetical protein
VAGSPRSHSRSCPRSSTAPASFHLSFARCTGPLKKGGPGACRHRPVHRHWPHMGTA